MHILAEKHFEEKKNDYIFLPKLFRVFHSSNIPISISPTCLCAPFTHVDPKIAKRQPSHQCLLALLKSAHAKAARKTKVKLTPGVNFIIVLRAAFAPVDLC